MSDKNSSLTADVAASRIREHFGEAVHGRTDFRGEVSLEIAAASLPEIARFCRDEMRFDYLVDISSVDHFGDEPRYEVVYELYGMEHGAHLRLKLRVDEESPVVGTVSNLWPTADWHEREVWDMMGIRFDGHPDLRRILMWEGYPYHPLRKDFPLEGLPSEMPDVAFTGTAPLAGGPFVTAPVAGNTQVREPRARHAGTPAPRDTFIAEP